MDTGGSDSTPPTALHADLASFTGAGYGSVRIPEGLHLEPSQTIHVTYDEADTLAAVVLAVEGRTAQIRVLWERPRRP